MLDRLKSVFGVSNEAAEKLLAEIAEMERCEKLSDLELLNEILQHYDPSPRLSVLLSRWYPGWENTDLEGGE